jgi:hypothetical protein
VNGRRARAIRRYADMAVTMSAYRHLGTSSKTLARRIRRVVTRTGGWEGQRR